MSPRSMRLFLIVSVAANIFVVSAVVGGSYMWVRSQEQAPPNWRQAAAEVLPRKERNAFLQAVRRIALDNRAPARQAVEGRAEAARLFVQPQFDAAAVSAALANARAADLQVRTSLEEAVVSFADKLTLDQRLLFAERLAKGPLRLPANAAPAAAPGKTASLVK